jgi:mRNA interferase RelE/StbE
MSWRIIYHEAVFADLHAIGPAKARTILDVIAQRIQNGEPDKSGKPLAGPLAGYRRIRSGNLRIVYRVNAGAVEVLIVAVGPRRNAEVYALAEGRV